MVMTGTIGPKDFWQGHGSEEEYFGEFTLVGVYREVREANAILLAPPCTAERSWNPTGNVLCAHMMRATPAGMGSTIPVVRA